ncbi:hypothetical protein U0070_027008 [Myodes glareolus]|uniref:Uncharacterized protein n=1 Tax=Myodes glareolus TaxID=447135 RepID=A0AAW0IIK2_MYOGA
MKDECSEGTVQEAYLAPAGCQRSVTLLGGNTLAGLPPGGAPDTVNDPPEATLLKSSTGASASRISELQCDLMSILIFYKGRDIGSQDRQEPLADSGVNNHRARVPRCVLTHVTTKKVSLPTVLSISTEPFICCLAGTGKAMLSNYLSSTKQTTRCLDFSNENSEDLARGRPGKVDVISFKLRLQICDFTGWEHISVVAIRRRSRHGKRPSGGYSAEVFHWSVCGFWNLRSGWIQELQCDLMSILGFYNSRDIGSQDRQEPLADSGVNNHRARVPRCVLTHVSSCDDWEHGRRDQNAYIPEIKSSFAGFKQQKGRVAKEDHGQCPWLPELTRTADLHCSGRPQLDIQKSLKSRFNLENQ